MGKRRRITVAPGEELDVLEEDFKIVREDWNEYELLDGGRVRAKLTVQKIYRPLDADGNPRYLPDGDPMILVSSSNQVTATE